MCNESLKNMIIISDLHCGSRLGLMPPEGIVVDEGNLILPSSLQLKVWDWWLEFWNDWVPMVTRNEKFVLVVNGDCVEGAPFNSVASVSDNMEDQCRIAVKVLKPVVEKATALYMIRGTESHVGKSGQQEENVARQLGAVPNDIGQYARWELWATLKGLGPIHILHHIGTTGSLAYETTALMKEYTEACSDAGRWGRPVPQVVVRSHRHRQAEIRVPSKKGYGICMVTPAWQLHTPFTWRIPGARLTTPQFGGSLIRTGDEELYTRHFVKSIERSNTEEL